MKFFNGNLFYLMLSKIYFFPKSEVSKYLKRKKNKKMHVIVKPIIPYFGKNKKFH